MTGTFYTFHVIWMATYLVTLCHTLLLYLSMDTLAPNVQFVSRSRELYATCYVIVRGGTVPDFRPVTNIRVALNRKKKA